MYRMWSLRRQASSECMKLRRFGGTERLSIISRIFIESALLYTLAVGISVVMELVNNNAFYATTDVVSQSLTEVHCAHHVILRPWNSQGSPSTSL